MLCKKCYVEGRVQGVFFRHTTRMEAESLAVTGYAKNLHDGRVEVLACGDQVAVEQLCNWLWEGSRLSDVTDVQCQEVTFPEILKDFTTR